MEHQHDTKIKDSTCPACDKHLSPKDGVKMAHYSLETLGDASILNGMRPEDSMKLFATSVKFWMQQTQTKVEYARHEARLAVHRKEALKKEFQEAFAEQTHRAESAQGQHKQLATENEELKTEMKLLQEKYQETQRTVRVLQEAVVELKRRRGGSPVHASEAGDDDISLGGRGYSHMQSPLQSPMHRQPSPHHQVLHHHKQPLRGPSFGGTEKSSNPLSYRSPITSSPRLGTPLRTAPVGTQARVPNVFHNLGRRC
jgi:hypothetical protein